MPECIVGVVHLAAFVRLAVLEHLLDIADAALLGELVREVEIIPPDGQVFHLSMEVLRLSDEATQPFTWLLLLSPANYSMPVLLHGALITKDDGLLSDLAIRGGDGDVGYNALHSAGSTAGGGGVVAIHVKDKAVRLHAH